MAHSSAEKEKQNTQKPVSRQRMKMNIHWYNFSCEWLWKHEETYAHGNKNNCLHFRRKKKTANGETHWSILVQVKKGTSDCVKPCRSGWKRNAENHANYLHGIGINFSKWLNKWKVHLNTFVGSFVSTEKCARVCCCHFSNSSKKKKQWATAVATKL